MTNFDDELKDAFARREAPDGFTDRVMARVAAENKKVVPIRRAPARWAAIAAAAVVLVTGGLYEQKRQERIRGEHAKDQLMLAIGITEQKLAIAGKRVEELNQRTIER